MHVFLHFSYWCSYCSTHLFHNEGPYEKVNPLFTWVTPHRNVNVALIVKTKYKDNTQLTEKTDKGGNVVETFISIGLITIQIHQRHPNFTKSASPYRPKARSTGSARLDTNLKRRTTSDN